MIYSKDTGCSGYGGNMKFSKKLAALVLAACTLFTGAFAKESPNITVFRPAVNARNKKDIMVIAAERYKQETGGKVTFVIGDWGSWQTKVLSNMAAGTPIDVIFAADQRFPQCYTKGYLQPLEDLVDLSAPNINKFGEENCFKFDGHYYLASNQTSNHYWIVIYNKSLMEEEGIKEEDQPYALWKAGKWDWNHMAALARKLTKDTSGNGIIDRWGLGNWQTRNFAYMNGVTFTEMDEHGNGKLNFDDPRLTEALAFLEKAKSEGWYQQDNNICQYGIQNRKLAMYMEREYFPVNIYTRTDDEICYVPLPVGPHGDPNKFIYETDGYGIGNGSQNPTYAAKYIEICLDEWRKYDEDLLRKNPPEINELTAVTSKNPWYPAKTANPVELMLDSFLGEIVWGGNSPAAAIEKWTPKAKALLDDANKPLGKMEKLAFKPINETFDKAKSLAAFPLFTEDGPTQITIEHVKGKNGIVKGSMLVKMDYERDGEDVTITLTDPEKIGFNGWTEFELEFDVKAVETPGKGAYVCAEGYINDYNKYGWNKVSVPSDGSVAHFRAKVGDIFRNGKVPLRIGAHNMKSFLIDNLTITEEED